MIEGFLNRLSSSSYKSNFILKGGFLLSSIIEKLGRTTRDIDFTGKGIENSPSRLKEIFIQVCGIMIDDELLFRTDKLTAEEIIEDGVYSGVRITVPCFLDRSRQTIQIDIGFDDSIDPEIKQTEYRMLLAGKTLNLFVYPVEAILAEKLEAMITLDEVNSRMKDFFDVYLIINNIKIDDEFLSVTIKRTFDTRKTVLSDNKAIFSEQFYKNPDRLKQWNGFLNRIKYQDKLEFEKVCKEIKRYFEPIYLRLKKLR
jgi:predicted nucleotidyltransferase component of viral defense system